MAGAKIHHADDFSITGLGGGMESGKPSVGLVIPLKDGSFVFAEEPVLNYSLQQPTC